MAEALSSSLHSNNIDRMESFDVNKLTYEIFSVLENKFLFGDENHSSNDVINITTPSQLHQCDDDMMLKSTNRTTGRVRILCIDGAASTDGILAAKSLAHLEKFLCDKSGNHRARIADYFDVATGSGAGGILAALLFARGKDGRPMLSADGALNFMIENRSKMFHSSAPSGIYRRIFKAGKLEKLFRKTFGELTLRDTMKAVLIPCYDLSTRAPFLFSRADAAEVDSYDFKLRDVCTACADCSTLQQMLSVDRKTKVTAVSGGIIMNNPTAAAITHVLNNKQEFPFCKGVEGLLVASLGNGEAVFSCGDYASSSLAGFTKIAGEGASDMVDQAISFAFGRCRASNYVRVQGNGGIGAKIDKQLAKTRKSSTEMIVKMAEDMLAQKNVEALLFEGKKVVECTNLGKIEGLAVELINEQERRKTSILPTVVLKHTFSCSPRTSSASSTTISTLSSC